MPRPVLLHSQLYRGSHNIPLCNHISVKLSASYPIFSSMTAINSDTLPNYCGNIFLMGVYSVSDMNLNLPPNTVLTPEQTEPDPSNLNPQVTISGTQPVETQPTPQSVAPTPATPTRPAVPKTPPTTTVAGRVIWYIGGVVSILLAFRFVLALLGANPGNTFAHFIYSVTTPLVSPFFGLFGYTPSYGVSRLEVFTLVAIAVYALVAWGLVKLVTITRPDGQ